MARMKRRHIQNNTLISSGLAGVSIVAIVQLASSSSLSLPLIIAVFCFAISIPLLAATIFILAQIGERPEMQVTNYYVVLLLGGMILSLGGVASLFFHFHYAAGGVFLVAMLVAIVLAYNHDMKIGLTKEEPSSDKPTPPNNSFNRTRN